MVKIENLTFSYKDGFNILDNINLEIPNGEYLAIIGPNGGGKSTLIKLLLNFLKPKSGSIKISSSKISYVPQHTNFSLDIPITVEDVVLQGRVKPFMFRYSKDDKLEARKVLKMVNMETFKNRKISDLSGGQRQRVLIARALASNPEILILDEPTSAIDINGQKEIYSLLKSIKITRIIVSHDINILLEGIDRVAFINRTLIIHDTPDLSNVKKGNGHFCEVELINYLKGEKSV